VRSAAEAPRPLTRLGYAGADGEAASGVAALARALEHVNLGWAMVAWAVQLPGVVRFLQVVVDAVGGGPSRVPVALSADGN